MPATLLRVPSQDQMRRARGEAWPLERRKRTMQRHGALLTDRASWDSHWADLARYILPRSPRFTSSDRNRGGAGKYHAIYDNTATRAVRVLGAGMIAGNSSPARPWVRLGTRDPDLNQYHPARLWLDGLTQTMLQIFQRSNLYRTLHQGFETLGVFGTDATLVLPDFENIIHCYPISCGQYALQQDYKGNVDTLYRQIQKTVAEVVREFGIENCSDRVQNEYREGNYDCAVEILHAIEPRPNYDPEKRDNLNMPWRSIYFELNEDGGHLLRESGFKRFPALTPRWSVQGGDVYGISPAMEALGDVKQLQQEQLSKGQGIAAKVRPPLQVPTTMFGRESDAHPGGVSYFDPGTMLPFDQVGPNGGVRTAYEVTIDLGDLLLDIQDVRQRIHSALYSDLFLMLATAGPDTRMTATEVAERHEEKLLMLGPALERLQNELYRPLIDLTFDNMLEMGLVPPPPAELQGMELEVEFISILAQAQRAVGIANVERFVGGATAIAQAHPEVLDKINFDAWADHTADVLGVPAKLVVDETAVRALRERRAAAQAAQAQVEAQQQQAAAARDLASADTTGQNALTDIMAQLTGYSTPAVQGGL